MADLKFVTNLAGIVRACLERYMVEQFPKFKEETQEKILKYMEDNKENFRSRVKGDKGDDGLNIKTIKWISTTDPLNRQAVSGYTDTYSVIAADDSVLGNIKIHNGKDTLVDDNGQVHINNSTEIQGNFLLKGLWAFLEVEEFSLSTQWVNLNMYKEEKPFEGGIRFNTDANGDEFFARLTYKQATDSWYITKDGQDVLIMCGGLDTYNENGFVVVDKDNRELSRLQGQGIAYQDKRDDTTKAIDDTNNQSKFLTAGDTPDAIPQFRNLRKAEVFTALDVTTIVEEAEIISEDKTLKTRVLHSDKEGTHTETITQIPLAKSGSFNGDGYEGDTDGLLSKERSRQIDVMQSELNVVKRLPKRYPVRIGLPPDGGFTQEQLNGFYQELVDTGKAPETIADGTVLDNIDEEEGGSFGVEYMYYATVDQWINRGISTITLPTETALGGVFTSNEYLKGECSAGVISINGLSDKLDSIDEKNDEQDQKITDIEANIDEIEDNVSGLTDRIDVVENTITTIGGNITNFVPALVVDKDNPNNRSYIYNSAQMAFLNNETERPSHTSNSAVVAAPSSVFLAYYLSGIDGERSNMVTVDGYKTRFNIYHKEDGVVTERYCTIGTTYGESNDIVTKRELDAAIMGVSQGIDGSSGSGTTDYGQLTNKPSINGEELVGDKSSDELNLVQSDIRYGHELNGSFNGTVSSISRHLQGTTISASKTINGTETSSSLFVYKEAIQIFTKYRVSDSNDDQNLSRNYIFSPSFGSNDDVTTKKDVDGMITEGVRSAVQEALQTAGYVPTGLVAPSGVDQDGYYPTTMIVHDQNSSIGVKTGNINQSTPEATILMEVSQPLKVFYTEDDNSLIEYKFDGKCAFEKHSWDGNSWFSGDNSVVQAKDLNDAYQKCVKKDHIRGSEESGNYSYYHISPLGDGGGLGIETGRYWDDGETHFSREMTIRAGNGDDDNGYRYDSDIPIKKDIDQIVAGLNQRIDTLMQMIEQLQANP
ncbi:MAG: hemolysin XhlA family protein [Helicobacteraceae bacterium]|jgi:hypothetical protein|nr:hemolysin XhlA family protein [Helicobacteraceae bacterium]